MGLQLDQKLSEQIKENLKVNFINMLSNDFKVISYKCMYRENYLLQIYTHVHSTHNLITNLYTCSYRTYI